MLISDLDNKNATFFQASFFYTSYTFKSEIFSLSEKLGENKSSSRNGFLVENGTAALLG